MIDTLQRTSTCHQPLRQVTRDLRGHRERGRERAGLPRTTRERCRGPTPARLLPPRWSAGVAYVRSLPRVLHRWEVADASPQADIDRIPASRSSSRRSAYRRGGPRRPDLKLGLADKVIPNLTVDTGLTARSTSCPGVHGLSGGRRSDVRHASMETGNEAGPAHGQGTRSRRRLAVAGQPHPTTGPCGDTSPGTTARRRAPSDVRVLVRNASRAEQLPPPRRLAWASSRRHERPRGTIDTARSPRLRPRQGKLSPLRSTGSSRTPRSRDRRRGGPRQVFKGLERDATGAGAIDHTWRRPPGV